MEREGETGRVDVGLKGGGGIGDDLTWQVNQRGRRLISIKPSSTTRPDPTGRDANRALVGVRRFVGVVPGDRSTDRTRRGDRVGSAEVLHPDRRLAPHHGEGTTGPATAELWREPLAVALRMVRPFELELGPVGWFGREILYLSVVGETVIDLHWRILDCLEQAGVDERFEYDGDEFVPHLTVGAPWVTADDRRLDGLQAAIEPLELPPFTVAEIIEFHRSGAAERYRPLGAFQLVGTT